MKWMMLCGVGCGGCCLVNVWKSLLGVLRFSGWNYNYNLQLQFKLFKHGGASRRKHRVFHTAV